MPQGSYTRFQISALLDYTSTSLNNYLYGFIQSPILWRLSIVFPYVLMIFIL